MLAADFHVTDFDDGVLPLRRPRGQKFRLVRPYADLHTRLKNRLEKTFQSAVAEGSRVGSGECVQHLFFAHRVVLRGALVCLNSPNLFGEAGAFGKQGEQIVGLSRRFRHEAR